MNKKTVVLVLLLSFATIFMFAGVTNAQVSGAGAKKDMQPMWLSDCEKKLEDFRQSVKAKPLIDFLPLWGKKLREMGYDLPLPVGGGVSFMAMRQTNKISDFKLMVEGEEIPLDIRF